MEPGRIPSLPSQPTTTSAKTVESDRALPNTGRLAEERSPKPVKAKEAEFPRESVEDLLERISEQINIERRSLSFQINDDIGKTIVSVIDVETDEVIRQIPSEELVRISRAIQEINEQRAAVTDNFEGTGLLIQERV